MKGSLKKASAICFAIAFLVLPITRCFLGNAIIESNIDNTYNDLIKLQEKAVLLSEKLDSIFGYDEQGNVNYPAEYAGRWVDGSNLVLSITSDDSKTIDKYMQWAGDDADYILIKKAKYSRELLTNRMDAAVSYLDSLGYTVTLWYVSDVDNNIVIGIKAIEDMQIGEMSLELSQYFDVPISIIISDEATQLLGLRGGDNLSLNLGATNITLSCCGKYQGNNVILTCGHGGQSLGTSIYYAGGVEIGSVVFHRCQNNGYGDFEFVAVDPVFYSTTNNITYAYSITGSVSNPPVNTTLKYYSRVSNCFCYGHVNAVGITGSFSGTTLRGMSSLKVLYGSANPGDSGGPFFQELTNSTAKYCGVISARSMSNGYLYVYFTPYSFINSAGFSVKTN